MEVFFCRVGWMKYYSGIKNDKITNGGAYIKQNIGHEAYNFREHNGTYYGFVHQKTNSARHIERLGCDKKSDYVDNILVVFVATRESGGQYIVGWYRNATVFRYVQTVPIEVIAQRELNDHDCYNIRSSEAVLIPNDERKYQIRLPSTVRDVWYAEGNDKVKQNVINYIDNYENGYEERIDKIEDISSEIVGDERETIIKSRINQDKFREQLLSRYKHCCLCGVDNTKLLIASHIKPWAKSSKYEKLNVNNGFLLCPNHDKLFDAGFITFSDDGSIIISDKLTDENRIFCNVRDDMHIKLYEENIEFIRYHRNEIFLR